MTSANVPFRPIHEVVLLFRTEPIVDLESFFEPLTLLGRFSRAEASERSLAKLC